MLPKSDCKYRNKAYKTSIDQFNSYQTLTANIKRKSDAYSQFKNEYWTTQPLKKNTYKSACKNLSRNAAPLRDRNGSNLR